MNVDPGGIGPKTLTQGTQPLGLGWKDRVSGWGAYNPDRARELARGDAACRGEVISGYVTCTFEMCLPNLTKMAATGGFLSVSLVSKHNAMLGASPMLKEENKVDKARFEKIKETEEIRGRDEEQAIESAAGQVKELREREGRSKDDQN
jgi:hypothetical protein